MMIGEKMITISVVYMFINVFICYCLYILSIEYRIKMGGGEGGEGVKGEYIEGNRYYVRYNG